MEAFAPFIIVLFLILLFVLHQAQKEINEQKYQNNRLKSEIDILEKRYTAIQKDNEKIQKNTAEQIDRQILLKASSIRQRPQYHSVPIFNELHIEPLQNARLLNAIKESMKIRDFQSSAKITSEHQNTYHTTLTSCTCMDFQIQKKPCKHMYRLAMEIGLLISIPTDGIETMISELNEKAHLAQEKQLALNKEKEILEKTKKDLEEIKNSSKQSFPWLASLFADYFYLEDLKISSRLEKKERPAYKAAEDVRQIAKEKKNLCLQLKLAENQLNFYETLFPWLLDFKEISPEDVEVIIENQENSNTENEYQLIKKYLSPQEYNCLSTAEKYQLALDRYKNRNKSKWEIGIEYERYIGYLYEKDGYKVSYTGALDGLEDMGRDLIVKSKNEISVIQCKRWSTEKTIHEKHIFQLYGSMVLYQIQHPERKVKGLFYTTTNLSSVAKDCAEFLGIKCYENYKHQEYPLVKCNISNKGEKIYHLPFDQMYDRVVIEPSKGECFTFTIKEAEEKGFRRAYRWKPE